MSKFENKYGELEEKMNAIIMRLNDYQQVINNLNKENESLRKKLAEAEKEMTEWKNKHQILGVTQSILQKEDKAELKKEINRLVREIDYCIGYINGK